MKPKEIIKSSLIIFYALLAGQIIFLLISLYLVTTGIIKTNSELSLILTIIILIFLSPLLIIGPIIYRKLISKQTDNLKTLEQKLLLYRQGMIIKLAMVEGATIFSIVCFLITGNFLFVIIAILLISLFFLHKPTLEKFASDFNFPLSVVESLEKSD
jgi:RsiW-degrading membrane proteinase PrsW (M82 family)